MNKFYSLTLKEVRPETRNAVSLAFDVPEDLADKFHYQQGQHLIVRTKLDGEEVRRSYSICRSVNDQELRIAIKQVPGGRFSTYANEMLKPGQTLEVMPHRVISPSIWTRSAKVITWPLPPAVASHRSCRS